MALVPCRTHPHRGRARTVASTAGGRWPSRRAGGASVEGAETTTRTSRACATASARATGGGGGVPCAGSTTAPSYRGGRPKRPSPAVAGDHVVLEGECDPSPPPHVRRYQSLPPPLLGAGTGTPLYSRRRPGRAGSFWATTTIWTRHSFGRWTPSARSTRSPRQGRRSRRASEGALAAMIDAAGPETATLEDAFWEEANAVCEEHDAQSAAKSSEGMKDDDEEEESLVLSCGDASLPPAISITAEGGEYAAAIKIEMRGVQWDRAYIQMDGELRKQAALIP